MERGLQGRPSEQIENEAKPAGAKPGFDFAEGFMNIGGMVEKRI